MENLQALATMRGASDEGKGLITVVLLDEEPKETNDHVALTSSLYPCQPRQTNSCVTTLATNNFKDLSGQTEETAKEKEPPPVTKE